MRFPLLTLLFLLVLQNAAFTQSTPTLFPLDYPNSIGTGVTGINTAGQMVGFYTDTGGTIHGFLFDQDLQQFFSFLVPKSASSTAFGINDEGVIVGCFTRDGDSTQHGFRRTVDAHYHRVDDPNTEETQGAAAINNLSVIVGTYTVPGGAFGYIVQNANFVTVAYPGAVFTFASGINDGGMIVGYWLDSNLEYHGFTLQNGAFADINVPGAISTQSLGLNNNGDIVGNYSDASHVVHGFLLQQAVFQTIDYPGAGGTSLMGINDSGTFVGEYFTGFHIQGFYGHD